MNRADEPQESGPALPTTSSAARSRWWVVFVFATAMAWVESAVVYYLRRMIGRIEPYQPTPLPIVGGLGPVELVREVATLLMLLTVGMLAGRTWRSRLGYAAVAFGVWDIGYYLFLKLMCGWPHSLMDWDILFLLPLPWWGPVLAPMLVALLMLLWGTLVNVCERPLPAGSSEWKAWLANSCGIVIALYVFMADTLRVAAQGVDVVRNVLPARFNWPLFCLALVLMAAPVWSVLNRVRERDRYQRNALNSATRRSIQTEANVCGELR